MGCVVDHFYVLVPNSARNLDALKKLAAHVRWVVFMLMSDNSKANARFKAFVTMEFPISTVARATMVGFSC